MFYLRYKTALLDSFRAISIHHTTIKAELKSTIYQHKFIMMPQLNYY